MCHFALCLISSRLMLTPQLLKLHQKCRATHSLAPDGSCCLGLTLHYSNQNHILEKDSNSLQILLFTNDDGISRHQKTTFTWLLGRALTVEPSRLPLTVTVTSRNHMWQASQQDAALRRANGRQLNPAELSFNAPRSSLCVLRATNRWVPEPLLQYKWCLYLISTICRRCRAKTL